MSFASDVKKEITALQMEEKDKKAELSAAVKMLSSISFSSKGTQLTIRSKNADVIKMISSDIQNLYGIKPVLEAIKETKFDKASTYALVVESDVRRILEDLALWTDNGLQEYPSMKFLSSDSMVRAYIAGCFLAAGSINNPNKAEYHMEISAAEEDHARFITRLLSRFYVNGRITQRRNRHVVYVKSSEQIADFLRVIGAYDALMTFEDVRIQRDYVNNVLRLNNCEAANDVKSLKTATEQYEAVRYLVENGHMEKLSRKEQEMAMLRYENPDVGLLELAELYEAATGTALSKSGVRHRFNKIMELARRQMKGDS